MQSLENQLIVTLDSLRYVLNGDPTQLRAAYAQYSDDLDRAHGQARRVDADIAEVRTQSAAYLATLDKDYAAIRNEELRRSTRQRRDQIDQRLQALQAAYDKAKAPLDAYLSRLDDVRVVLRNDLTTPGVQAIAQTGVVRSADADATRVREGLAQTRASGDALAGELSAPESASR
jgi:chromosome segregation ATPase